MIATRPARVSPRPARRRNRGVATVLALWLVVVGSMGFWISAQLAVDRIRETWQPAYPLLFLPNGRYLGAASFGYRVVLADAIYLWSIQYYGHRRTVEGRNYLWHIYDVITDLDPHFVDAYTTGALVMASDMDDTAMAIRLLDKGIDNNPDEWRLPMEAGWYCYLRLEDYGCAEHYYQMAIDKPDAPPFAARLRAHMVARQGDLRDAVLAWEAIRQEAEEDGDEQTVAIAHQHVYDLTVRISTEEVEAGLARFRERLGRDPEDLAELTRRGFVRRNIFLDEEGYPTNLNGDRLLWDRQTGEISDPAANEARSSR